MGLFLQLLGNGLVQGAVAVLYAASFGFVYRSFRVFHIAMGAQFVFACYAFYTCATMCKLPLAVSVPTVLVLSAAFAALIECAVYRPFVQKRCSSGVVMIASLGVMIVLENVVALIEHNMGVVRKLADYIYFLHEGTVYTHGTQQDVLDNPEVRDLYTGNSGGATL